MSEPTGRRRCGIPEHRRQIRGMQRQVEYLRLHATQLYTQLYEANMAREEAIRQTQTIRSWIFLWPCRWFGHHKWGQRFGEDRCGRCGITLPPKVPYMPQKL